MKKYLTSFLSCAILACIFSVYSFAQNTPTLPESIGNDHDSGFGGGPRRSGGDLTVTYIVAYDEEARVVDCVEDTEENAEYIEILAEDPKLFLTELTIDE